MATEAPTRVITYVTGDATLPPGPGPKVIAHIVNDQGGWGAGFSGALSKRYPRAESTYRARHTHAPGDCRLVWVAGDSDYDDVWVAHLWAQRGYKSATNPQPLSYEDLTEALGRLRGELIMAQSPEGGMGDGPITIHMPRIGAGLGGGDWGVIERIIAEELHDREVFVYDLPKRKEANMTTQAPAAQKAITFRSPREQPYGCLHNFAAIPVVANGRAWPTSEHLYQATKLPLDHPAIERIANAPTPKEAKRIAYEHQAEWRRDWELNKISVMHETLGWKLGSSAQVREALASTKGQPIVELSSFDTFWGQVDGKGHNWLGRLWESIRDETDLEPEVEAFRRQQKPPQAQRPAAIPPVCTIQTPAKYSAYTDLDDAIADIARAATKGGYLLVGVVGSRNRGTVVEARAYAEIAARVTDPQREHRRELAVIAQAVDEIRALHDLPLAKVAIVSGGASGVDTLAEHFAQANNLPLIVFPAHWNRAEDGGFDKLAGFARNSHIALMVDELLALPRNETKADGTQVPAAKSGTFDTITKARLRKVPVTIK